MAYKIPFATTKELAAAVAAYPTPFYLYDEAGIRARVQALHEAFAWNPGFREYFAVKANPNPAIISILAEYGCGVDCASGTELMLARALGMSASDIMFSSNETPDADYRLAHRLGAITNLDDITQLDHYRRACGAFPPAMSVRYNPGGVLTDATGIQGEPETSKFGMTRDQVFSALQSLAAEGVQSLGIHAFLSSNTLGTDYYPRLAHSLFELVRDVQATLGIELSFVNLSGGIGVDYRPEDTPADIAAIGKGVHEAFLEVLGAEAISRVAIATELGRFMLAPFGLLVARVIGEKHTYRDYLGLDACAADLIRPMMYGAYHHITVVGKQDATHVYDVVGGLCENTDRFALQRRLPECHEGDVLVIHDAGAHARAMGFNYNGKLRPAEVLLTTSRDFRLIRRAETPADYFATLDCLEIGERLIQEVQTWI